MITSANLILCPVCGTPYIERDAVHSEELSAKHGKPVGIRPSLMQSETKKKKLLSEQGDIIPADDKLAIADMSRGKRIISYREYLP